MKASSGSGECPRVRVRMADMESAHLPRAGPSVYFYSEMLPLMSCMACKGRLTPEMESRRTGFASRAVHFEQIQSLMNRNKSLSKQSSSRPKLKDALRK